MVEAPLLAPNKCGATIGSLIGLTSDEARRQLAQFGPNSVSEAVPPRWRRYLAKFWSPIAWLLEVAMIVEFGLGKYVEAAVIARESLRGLSTDTLVISH